MRQSTEQSAGQAAAPNEAGRACSHTIRLLARSSLLLRADSLHRRQALQACVPPLEPVHAALISHHGGGGTLVVGVVAGPDIHCRQQRGQAQGRMSVLGLPSWFISFRARRCCWWAACRASQCMCLWAQGQPAASFHAGWCTGMLVELPLLTGLSCPLLAVLAPLVELPLLPRAARSWLG